MQVVFSPIFVADAKIICCNNFVAPLNICKKNLFGKQICAGLLLDYVLFVKRDCLQSRNGSKVLAIS